MATTPEGKVKDAVKELLKVYSVYYHMPVQNGMGNPSLDFIGCHHGRFFAVETKAPGKEPTGRQELTMRVMRAAGATVFVVDGVDTLKNLEFWLLNNEADSCDGKDAAT